MIVSLRTAPEDTEHADLLHLNVGDVFIQ